MNLSKIVEYNHPNLLIRFLSSLLPSLYSWSLLQLQFIYHRTIFLYIRDQVRALFFLYSFADFFNFLDRLVSILLRHLTFREHGLSIISVPLISSSFAKAATFAKQEGFPHLFNNFLMKYLVYWGNDATNTIWIVD